MAVERELSPEWPSRLLLTATANQTSEMASRQNTGLRRGACHQTTSANPALTTLFRSCNGGNGITFSFLAAEPMAASLAGGSSPLLDDLAIDRDIPS
ncbi:hypothetical protein XH79_09740 [Bradyrhizobium sp. CCBAU 45389]|nr:hypothetical protein [Bradyrhizobium sp. CCBAU 45389]